MSKIGRRINLLVIAASLFVVSCSTTEGDGLDEDNRAISFQMPQTVSRAAIDQFPARSTFLVWGGYDNNATGIFNGETVTESKGSWNYSGGTRYWAPEKIYDFYAVYPKFPAKGTEGQTTATVAPDGTITISNFDCSKTGKEAVDLMTASNTGISYVSGEPNPVALKFSHELARLSFVVQSEGSRVQIEQISIVGVGYKGTFTSPNSWTVTELSTESSPFSRTMFEVNPDETGVDVFGDILLLPATADQLKNAKLKLTYRYEYNGTTGKLLSKEISLATPAVQSWDKGQSYNYKLSIPVQSEDLKLNVTVLPWNKNEDASVEW